jgi:formate/nitrite transporter FocA (FNT family)
MMISDPERCHLFVVSSKYVSKPVSKKSPFGLLLVALFAGVSTSLTTLFIIYCSQTYSEKMELQ